MACPRGRLLRLCLSASLLSILMGLILLSLLQQERDELERLDAFAPPHHQTIVNGHREILQSRGTPIVSSDLESQTQFI